MVPPAFIGPKANLCTRYRANPLSLRGKAPHPTEKTLWLALALTLGGVEGSAKGHVKKLYRRVLLSILALT